MLMTNLKLLDSVVCQAMLSLRGHASRQSVGGGSLRQSGNADTTLNAVARTMECKRHLLHSYYVRKSALQ